MSILDNQEVNADILNGIAIDLGATDFSEFKDGEKFGADKINAITAALVTSGVISNDGESCNVTVSNGMISVGTGTIIFNTGAKMKITENQTLELVENTKTYVVAVNDVSNNRMLLYNLETEPTEEDDYVLLAEVSADGEVVDKRAWATSKYDDKGGPVYEEIPLDEAVWFPNYSSQSSKTINLTRSGYHIMLFIGTIDSVDVSGTSVYLLGEDKITKYFSHSNAGHMLQFTYDGKSTVQMHASLTPGSSYSTGGVSRQITGSLYLF